MRIPSVVLFAIVLSAPGVGQRVIPPTRDQNPVPAIRHLQVKPQNVRGTYFTLARNETAESFWSRYEDNAPSVEFVMAMLAREGVNQVRQWSSYRSYLFARYHGYSGGPEANGHWGRVRAFCDLAHDYDISVSLVLLNTFGFQPPGESWVLGTGGLPTPRIIPDGNKHVGIRLNCFATTGCTTWESLRLFVGHPDELDPFADDPDYLFPSPEWRDGASGTFPDFLQGYLEQLAAGQFPAVTSMGLQELEFVNEPERMVVSGLGGHCLKVFQKVNTAAVNPTPFRWCWPRLASGVWPIGRSTAPRIAMWTTSSKPSIPGSMT